MEWKVLQYCIRYGFLDFCEGVETEGVPSILNVLEFIDDELSADDISFSEQDFALTYDTLKQLLPQFRNDLLEFKSRLESIKKEKKGKQDSLK